MGAAEEAKIPAGHPGSMHWHVCAGKETAEAASCRPTAPSLLPRSVLLQAMMGSNKAAASDSYDFDLAGDDEEEQEMASPAPAPKAKVGRAGWLNPVMAGVAGSRGWLKAGGP